MVVITLLITLQRGSLKGELGKRKIGSPRSMSLNLKENVRVYVFVFFKFLLDQGPFCGATDCPYFRLVMTLPMGFKARVVLLPVHLLACVR